MSPKNSTCTNRTRPVVRNPSLALLVGLRAPPSPSRRLLWRWRRWSSPTCHACSCVCGSCSSLRGSSPTTSAPRTMSLFETRQPCACRLRCRRRSRARFQRHSRARSRRRSRARSRRRSRHLCPHAAAVARARLSSRVHFRRCSQAPSRRRSQARFRRRSQAPSPLSSQRRFQAGYRAGMRIGEATAP